MAALEIVGWQEHNVGFTGWDNYARTELKKRLRSGINASPGEIRSLAKQICSREILTVHNVHEESVQGVRQILETMGAVVSLRP